MAKQAMREKWMVMDDLNALYPAAERGWNRLAREELLVCAKEFAGYIKRFTR